MIKLCRLGGELILLLNLKEKCVYFLWYKFQKYSVVITLYYFHTKKIYLQNIDKVEDINSDCSKDMFKDMSIIHDEQVLK